MTIELTLSGTDVTDTTPINAITEDAHRLSLERPDLLLLTSFLTVLTSSSSSSKRLAKRFSEDYTTVTRNVASIKPRGGTREERTRHIPFLKTIWQKQKCMVERNRELSTRRKWRHSHSLPFQQEGIPSCRVGDRNSGDYGLDSNIMKTIFVDLSYRVSPAEIDERTIGNRVAAVQSGQFFKAVHD